MPDADPARLYPGRTSLRRLRPVALGALATLVALLVLFGLWTRQQADGNGEGTATTPGELLVASQARGTPLTAVGRGRGLPAPCTVWLLDVAAPVDASAYAVTTAQCAGILDATTVTADRPVSGATVDFQAFAPLPAADAPGPVAVAVDRVAWASARWTDIAILQLAASYGDLAARGVDPIRVVAPADQGTQILVAGVPVQGVALDEQYLRGSRCQVGATTDVLEHPWIWRGVQAIDCHGILGGSWGSPALDPDGRAVGMVTTTTIGARGGKQCYPGKPCEVGERDVRLRGDTSYLVGLGDLAACFPGGRFSISAGCPLEDPDGVVRASAAVRSATPGSLVEVGLADPGNARVAHKAGPVGRTDCFAESGWSDPVRARRWTWGEPLAEDEGWILLCVGSADQPTPVLVESDGTAPDRGSIELTRESVPGGVRVQPVVDPPELSRFRWVSGPGAAVRCSRAEGYVAYQGVPAVIQVDDLPSTVCVIAFDEAGNRSRPASFPVEGG